MVEESNLVRSLLLIISRFSTAQMMFLLLFCRKQASLWIQGDIFRTREKDKAERGLFLSACFPTSFLGSKCALQNYVWTLI